MRKIIHIDMDAFFASVEQRDFPEYQGRPVIVGGKPERRGVVAACSYEAREFGIHSAMPSSRAIKLCPKAVFMAPRFEAYRACSKQIHRIFQNYTNLIEPLSLDEAYLDVTECRQCDGSATRVAEVIRKQIKNQLGLTASAGVSYNKFLAKIASDMNKPDGQFVIKPDQAESFIETLPIRKFFGVGKVTEARMHALGIFTGADLKRLSKQQLKYQFGKSGSYYYNIVRGVDDRAVRISRQRKSLGKETTYACDIRDKKIIWQTLLDISRRLDELLLQRQLTARTVTLKVKYHDFKLITRSQTQQTALQSQQQILQVLPQLLRKTQVGKRAIRLIGITLSGLISSAEKMPVNDSQTDRQPGLF